MTILFRLLGKSSQLGQKSKFGTTGAQIKSIRPFVIILTHLFPFRNPFYQFSSERRFCSGRKSNSRFL